MRVLLQNTETKLYFVDTNQWTDDPSKAKDFQEVEHAAQIYHLQGPAYAKIVVEPNALELRRDPVEALLKYVQASG